MWSPLSSTTSSACASVVVTAVLWPVVTRPQQQQSQPGTAGATPLTSPHHHHHSQPTINNHDDQETSPPPPQCPVIVSGGERGDRRVWSVMGECVVRQDGCHSVRNQCSSRNIRHWLNNMWSVNTAPAPVSVMVIMRSEEMIELIMLVFTWERKWSSEWGVCLKNINKDISCMKQTDSYTAASPDSQI